MINRTPARSLLLTLALLLGAGVLMHVGGCAPVYDDGEEWGGYYDGPYIDGGIYGGYYDRDHHWHEGRGHDHAFHGGFGAHEGERGHASMGGRGGGGGGGHGGGGGGHR